MVLEVTLLLDYLVFSVTWGVLSEVICGVLSVGFTWLLGWLKLVKSQTLVECVTP